MITIELRYLMGSDTTAQQVHSAGVGLAAELTALASEVLCVHVPEVEAALAEHTLIVRVGICPAGAPGPVLTVARSAVLAAAQRTGISIKEVPGTHRLVDVTADAEAA